MPWQQSSAHVQQVLPLEDRDLGNEHPHIEPNTPEHSYAMRRTDLRTCRKCSPWKAEGAAMSVPTLRLASSQSHLRPALRPSSTRSSASPHSNCSCMRTAFESPPVYSVLPRQDELGIILVRDAIIEWLQLYDRRCSLRPPAMHADA